LWCGLCVFARVECHQALVGAACSAPTLILFPLLSPAPLCLPSGGFGEEGTEGAWVFSSCRFRGSSIGMCRMRCCGAARGLQVCLPFVACVTVIPPPPKPADRYGHWEILRERGRRVRWTSSQLCSFAIVLLLAFCLIDRLIGCVVVFPMQVPLAGG
jgi:hypothetical protein